VEDLLVRDAGLLGTCDVRMRLAVEVAPEPGKVGAADFESQPVPRSKAVRHVVERDQTLDHLAGGHQALRRFLILLAFTDAVASTEGVRHAITTALSELPAGLRRTLTGALILNAVLEGRHHRRPTARRDWVVRVIEVAVRRRCPLDRGSRQYA
jgi:hypothetical protein